jgi:hypothetical protein
MKQEDKELLFKDICARLPYKVKVSYYDDETERQECDVVDSIYEDTQEIGVGQWCLKIDKFKPYLFPLSSMTDEQKEELKQRGWYFDCFEIYNVDKHGWREAISHEDCFDLIDWLNKNHFDYRGLIEKSLALDATNLNIY